MLSTPASIAYFHMQALHMLMVDTQQAVDLIPAEHSLWCSSEVKFELTTISQLHMLGTSPGAYGTYIFL